MAGVAAIGVRRGFVPQHAILNSSHPLAVGLVFCGIPALGYELAKNRPVSSSLAEKTPSSYGFSSRATWSNASTVDMEFSSGSHTNAVAYNYFGAPSGAQKFFRRSTYVSESSNSGWELNGNTGPVTNYTLFRNDSNYVFSASAFVYDGVAVGISDGTTKRIYINSQQITSSTTGNLLPVATTADVNMSFGGSATIACSWDRVLTSNEIAMFVADPFCMLNS